ncbi:unnamed protein product [Linum trigynum]|uniref:Protein kinase domain-containing protein n=1 Tax=Linum trigynum TaxID=586398 RepID=A0AAV2G1M2_9ROSI
MEKNTLLPLITATKLLLLLHLLLPAVTSLSRPLNNPNVIHDDCSDKCGNVTVPYPFGIGRDPKCAFSDAFLLNCTSPAAARPEVLVFRNITVTKISVEEGTLSGLIRGAYSCYNKSGPMRPYRYSNQSITLGDGPFRFSNVHNKFTVFGCDTIALIMSGDSGIFIGGCISFCDGVSAAEASRRISAASNSSVCPGNGCCQSSIPRGLKTLDFKVESSTNHSHILDSNPCDFAFLADDRDFDFGRVNLSEYPNWNPSNASTAIEWVVEEKHCKEARSNSSSYACREKSDCVYSGNGNGYRCLCSAGYRGNPYLGCQDINECEEPEKYPCHGRCKNTEGNYTCSCPIGKHGDGKVACQVSCVTTIVAVTGSIILLFTTVLLTFIMYRRRKQEKNFLLNGGMLLKHQRVRIFRELELSKATNSYDATRLLGQGGFGHVYKGILPDNTLIAIKKPKNSLVDKSQTINQEFQHEIAIVSQVNHINVVKVVGLCLETKLPLLVYEFIPNGTLSDHIHRQRSNLMSTWTNRLRIATEIAQALDYLHSLANPPIIHGDIKSTNILLDEVFRAKVADFGASVLIYPDQATAMVSKIQGTLGYLDPEYLVTGDLTPMSDVYSFGVVMVELLTGRKPHSVFSSRTEENGNLIMCFLNSVGDRNLGSIVNLEVIRGWEMEEIEAFAEVARRCLNSSGIERPAMKEVAEELGQLMRKLNEHDRTGDNDGEEGTGGESFSSISGCTEFWTGRTERPAEETQSIVAVE